MNTAERIRRAVAASRGNRKALMEQIHRSLGTALRREGIDAIVTGREKHIYSIYQKMKTQRKPFNEIMDVFGFRAVMFVEWGFRPADVRRTTERIKVPGAVVKEWVRKARQEEKVAREAEADGHRESSHAVSYPTTDH